MNIFVSNPNPIISAKSLDDKRLIKMILESTQLLMTALNHTNQIKMPYKSTHINHPCSKWVRETRSNYLWLYEHYKALCLEYSYRFTPKQHKCFSYQEILYNNAVLIPDGELTPFTNCTIFKEEPDVFKAYKLALNNKWENDKIKPKWTNTNPPDWYSFKYGES